MKVFNWLLIVTTGHKPLSAKAINNILFNNEEAMK